MKPLKSISYGPEWTPENHRTERYRWLENASRGLRVVGKVHEIRMNGHGNLPYIDRSLIDHNGWFIDNYQDEAVCGAVLQMPSRNGKEMYLPAIEDRYNPDCYIVNFRSATDDVKDAVRWADSMAESYAESEREYQAKQSAETRIEDIDAEIKTLYQDYRKLATEIRANCDKLKGLPEIQSAIRSKWQRTRSEIVKLRAEKRKLQDNFWAVCPNY